jgi:hypothetical protein
VMAKAYGIRFEGRLTQQDREAFCDMKIIDVPPGTLIYGSVIDESHLHGIIAQLRAMGITVTSVHPVLP